MTKNTYTAGFTLLETLIYLSLYSILIGGAVVGAYAVFESSAHNQTKAMVEEEGSYLIGKIDWALSGAQTISNPTAGTSTALTVAKYDGTAVDLYQSGSSISMRRNGGTPEVLSNLDVSIDSLIFEYRSNPKGIEATMHVSARSSTGLPFARSFSTVKYLRSQ